MFSALQLLASALQLLASAQQLCLLFLNLLQNQSQSSLVVVSESLQNFDPLPQNFDSLTEGHVRPSGHAIYVAREYRRWPLAHCGLERHAPWESGGHCGSGDSCRSGLQLQRAMARFVLVTTCWRRGRKSQAREVTGDSCEPGCWHELPPSALPVRLGASL